MENKIKKDTENKELNNPMLNELDEDVLLHVSGGTEDDGWYWGYGFPPHYLNACPNCGGGVYDMCPPVGEEYTCGPCGWTGHSQSEFAAGYTENR